MRDLITFLSFFRNRNVLTRRVTVLNGNSWPYTVVVPCPQRTDFHLSVPLSPW